MIVVAILLSLSALLFARAVYIIKADKNQQRKLANMTNSEMLNDMHNKLSILKQITTSNTSKQSNGRRSIAQYPQN